MFESKDFGQSLSLTLSMPLKENWIFWKHRISGIA